MELTKIESSNIEAIGWQSGTLIEGILYVMFKTGTIYEYSPVSEEVFKEMLAINEAKGSVGKYFNANIKGNPKIFYQVHQLDGKTVERIDTLLGSKPNAIADQPERGVLSGKGVVNAVAGEQQQKRGIS